MTALWHETAEGWSLLQPAGFPDEATLHDLVAKEPQLMPLSGSPQLAVLGREVTLGSGYADILAVEDSGRPVVIEVKLAQSSEARRAVVAQALAYASYLDGLSVEELERRVLARHLHASGHTTISDAIAADDQEGAFDSEEFTRGLEESMAGGSFRVVLVLDQAPAELVQLVGYLERVSGDLTIDLITVGAYEVGGSRVIVPQRVDSERKPSEEKVSKTDATRGQLSEGAEAFEKGIESAPRDQEELRRLLGWARELEREGLVRLLSFRGITGGMTLLTYVWNDEAGLVTVWNDKGASLQLWRSVFERRAPDSIAPVEAELGARIGQGNTTREVSDSLLAAIADAYREARSSTN
jgi:hypothetical protein